MCVLHLTRAHLNLVYVCCKILDYSQDLSVYKDAKANRTNKKNSREKKIHFGNPVLNLFNKDNLKNMVKDPKYELFARMKKKERYMNIKPKKQRRIFAYEYVCHQFL